jgi:hypothetical protein
LEPIEVNARERMAEAVVRLEQAGCGHIVPLVRAAMAGDLGFALVGPGQTLPPRLLDAARQRRPLAVVLGDDGAAPTGPAGFPQARRLLRWAAHVFVHATGGRPEHYAAAARITVAARRLLLVETCTAQQAAWSALARALAPRTPGTLLITRPGAPAHPRLSAPVGATPQ